jgi:hypothetical protein
MLGYKLGEVMKNKKNSRGSTGSSWVGGLRTKELKEEVERLKEKR